MLNPVVLIMIPLFSPSRASEAVHVFIAQLFNTALLMMILRTNYGVTVTEFFFAHNLETFNFIGPKWYAVVAMPVVTTISINMLAPPIVHFILYYLWPFPSNTSKSVTYRLYRQLRYYCSGRPLGAYTQNELNQMFDVDVWNIAAAYAELLLSTFVVLMYSSGVPLLLWVGFFGLVFKYFLRPISLHTYLYDFAD